jgi:outer membrane lipoprotein-sorting protein
MRYLVSAATALAIVGPAVPGTAATLADVSAALKATTSMEADFRQVAGDGRTATGRMSLKRPGRVRFDYGPSAPILVVADGRRLSFIDYRVRQVSQYPLGRTPLGVLLDPDADLSRIARVLPEAESPIPGQIAVAASDPKRPERGRILFFLARDAKAPGGLALTGWRVLDSQNNLTVVELDGIRWNPEIPDSRFTFQDPRLAARRPAGR